MEKIQTNNKIGMKIYKVLVSLWIIITTIFLSFASVIWSVGMVFAGYDVSIEFFLVIVLILGIISLILFIKKFKTNKPLGKFSKFVMIPLMFVTVLIIAFGLFSIF